MDLKERIVTHAKELGFCKIGFTTADDLPRVYEQTVERDYPETFLKMAETGARPREIAPDAKSIIVLAFDFSDIDYPKEMLERVGMVYLSQSFLPLDGSPARERLNAFEEFLESEGVPFVDGRPIMIRPAAMRAGVASFGKNNFSYVDGVGSFVTLYAYLTPVEFEPDEPTPECECPPNCHLCIDACPTNAMGEPFNLDCNKCIVWVNALSWSRGDVRDVPLDLRTDLGEHIHGCDVCQMVCPRNRPALKQSKKPDAVLERIAPQFSLENLLHMPDGFYEDCVFPIMYNYVRDPVVFQRNAAIAMGNSGDPKYIPDLEEELNNPNEVIRSHVQWALDQLKATV